MDYRSAKQKLELKKTGLYAAGHPTYGRNFSRDSLIYGLLASDQDALLRQIDYSAQKQGTKHNSITGEEPGKIHHEFPAGKWRGRPTTYNACDTGALFLIAISVLAQSGSVEILDTYKHNIDAAISYIKNHKKRRLIYRRSETMRRR